MKVIMRTNMPVGEFIPGSAYTMELDGEVRPDVVGVKHCTTSNGVSTVVIEFLCEHYEVRHDG